jgi:hypothetical protein
MARPFEFFTTGRWREAAGREAGFPREFREGAKDHSTNRGKLVEVAQEFDS